MKVDTTQNRQVEFRTAACSQERLCKVKQKMIQAPLTLENWSARDCVRENIFCDSVSLKRTVVTCPDHLRHISCT